MASDSSGVTWKWVARSAVAIVIILIGGAWTDIKSSVDDLKDEISVLRTENKELRDLVSAATAIRTGLMVKVDETKEDVKDNKEQIEKIKEQIR